MKKLVLISLALCSAAVLAGDQTAPGFDRNAAEAKAKALFERYIARDEMLDRYYERFNNASQGIAVQGSLLRDWDNVTPKFSVHEDLTFCWYGPVFLAVGPEGKVRNAAISSGTLLFRSHRTACRRAVRSARAGGL